MGIAFVYIDTTSGGPCLDSETWEGTTLNCFTSGCMAQCLPAPSDGEQYHARSVAWHCVAEVQYDL